MRAVNGSANSRDTATYAWSLRTARSTTPTTGAAGPADSNGDSFAATTTTTTPATRGASKDTATKDVIADGRIPCFLSNGGRFSAKQTNNVSTVNDQAERLGGTAEMASRREWQEQRPW